MSISEKCGLCAYYEPIEGIFGNCKEKSDTVFSSDPKCDTFLFKPQEVTDSAAPSFTDFGNRHIIDPRLLAFMGTTLPKGFMPQHGCQHNQKEPKPEKTEWENPLYRKKKKPRKVIDFIARKKEKEASK